MAPLKYGRILLKLSGEAMKGSKESGIDFAYLDALASGPLKELVSRGAQVGIVIGGGNIIRGGQAAESGVSIDRAVLDDLGMLSTVMNSIALRGALEDNCVRARVLSATPMEKVADYYTRSGACRLLDDGVVAIFAGGTGNPYFTTDSAAALRGAEIGADALFKATNVDGVYDRDPNKDASATRFTRLSFDEAIERQLRVMDLTAFSICRDQNLPIIVFRLDPLDNIVRLTEGADLGTTVGGE
jgi:uridylate kinase